jgi:hypothetical protein
LVRPSAVAATSAKPLSFSASIFSASPNATAFARAAHRRQLIEHVAQQRDQVA